MFFTYSNILYKHFSFKHIFSSLVCNMVSPWAWLYEHVNNWDSSVSFPVTGSQWYTLKDLSQNHHIMTKITSNFISQITYPSVFLLLVCVVLKRKPKFLFNSNSFTHTNQPDWFLDKYNLPLALKWFFYNFRNASFLS
jgi:hypothetical protein